MQLIEDDFDWEEFDVAPERHKVIKASTLAQEVIDGFYAPEEERGDYLPWDKSTDRVRLREHEVTLWVGYNGHRKSMITTQVAMGLLGQDCRVLLMSFEMRPKATMMRMSRMAAATDAPSPEFVRKLHTWTEGKLWLYDHYGGADQRQVLAVCRYAATELGVKHVFIDSLMKCVKKTDDYSEQKLFVGDLCTAAATYPLHIHLIAHAKKGDEDEVLEKGDTKGASEIVDQVDNAIMVQKNMRKEKQRADGGENPDDVDQWLGVRKQRNGAYEGTMGFYFHPESLRLTERRGSPVPFELR